jgi:hypothetical protein
MDIEELIQKLKEKADQKAISDDFPPLSSKEVMKCEKKLGFKLPELLKRVYTEVANGGIGPGEMLMGLCVDEGNASIDLGENALEAYEKFMSHSVIEDFEDEAKDVVWEWAPGVMPMCDWSTGVLTVLDCNLKHAPMILCKIEHPQIINYKRAFESRSMEFKFPGTPLETWLASWIDGTEEKYMPEGYGTPSAQPPPPPRAADQLEGESQFHYELRKKAETGDVDAQYELGRSYFQSDGEKSHYWYEKSAENGHLGGISYMAKILRDSAYIADWDRGFKYAQLLSPPAGYYLDKPDPCAGPGRNHGEKWWHQALPWWRKRAEKEGDPGRRSLFS